MGHGKQILGEDQAGAGIAGFSHVSKAEDAAEPRPQNAANEASETMHHRQVLAELNGIETTGASKLAQTLPGESHLVCEVTPEYSRPEDTLSIGYVHNQFAAGAKCPICVIHNLEDLILAEMLDHIESDYHVEHFTVADAEKTNEISGHDRTHTQLQRKLDLVRRSFNAKG